jgi:hypothetical protein
VGGQEKFQKQKKKKKKLGGGGYKILFPKKKTGKEVREKIKFQKKLRSGLRKGKKKTSTWDGTGIEKRILSVHHPSTLVHRWVLVHSGR